MRLVDFGVLCDENVALDAVERLRDLMPDVRTVADYDLAGASDVEVLKCAHAEHRMVLTHDSDFGQLAISAEEPFTGIVYLRPGHIRSDHAISMLRALLDLDPALTVPFIIVIRRTAERILIRLRHVT